MGHIGFTPQFKKKFEVEGQTTKEINQLLKEAKLIEKAGAFSIVLECLSPQAARLITQKLNIPTIGIGSSSHCDGQILVTDDMLGLSGFYPKFVKKYVNLNRIIESYKNILEMWNQVNFQQKKNFKWLVENKTDLKTKLFDFYNSNKAKIYFLIFVILLIITSIGFIKYKSEKNNIILSEKYIEAGVKLSSNQNDEAKKIYEEIIYSKNNFYSILALNKVLEKNLISDKNKILEYFEILEKSTSLKSKKI